MDLNLLPLYRHKGQDLSNLPGLHIAAPPRRPARGRQIDRLILYFILEGITPYSPEQLNQLLTGLTQTYYQTPGSVTAALRTVAEKLNDMLLERNLHASSSGQQGTGLLALAVLRGDQLILCQCGPVRAYLIQAGGAQRLFDPESIPRGLGQSRALSIHYSQANLSVNDTLLITHQPSLSWSEGTLSGVYGQGPEGIRRRLFGQAGSDFQAVLLQARSGPGRVHLLLPPANTGPDHPEPATFEELPTPVPGDRQPARSNEPAPVTAMKPAEPSAGMELFDPAEGSAAPLPQSTPDVLPQPAAWPEPVSRELEHPAPSTQPVSVPVEPAAPPKPRPATRAPSSTRRALARTFGRLAKTGQALGQRMLPGEGTLPSSVMAFLAVAVPLVVVTVATLVYFQRGRAEQYQAYYSQAVQAAQEAQSQTDPQARRTAWGTVIANLDRADAYGITPESRDLRGQAQSVFDELEGIRRLDYEPAISGGLPRSFQISQIVATDNELYLLDSASGSVARAVQTGQVYEMDNGFQCGPGLPVGQATGKIIDIAPMPIGNEAKATVLAMDEQGNLLQCIPGEQPVFNVLAPPTTNWGKPRAFTYDLGNLYVLDPQTNAVWVYWGGDFDSQPQFFFSENVPPMEDVIDLAVDKNDLYLLHVDGHITLCTFSNLGVSPTRCNDPFPYADSRVGREGQILLPEAPFVQVRTTLPPDPSLYLLQADTQAIYHFSLRLLTFQRQLRSQNQLPTDSPATAFAIRPDGRVVFMALGDRVYYAGMP